MRSDVRYKLCEEQRFPLKSEGYAELNLFSSEFVAYWDINEDLRHDGAVVEGYSQTVSN